MPLASSKEINNRASHSRVAAPERLWFVKMRSAFDANGSFDGLDRVRGTQPTCLTNRTQDQNKYPGETMRTFSIPAWLIAVAVASTMTLGCSVEQAPAPDADGGTTTSGGDAGSDPDGSGMATSGTIEIDGSSTVFPISSAVGEIFMDEKGDDVKVNTGRTGTGGGFKRFVTGETDISDASRPIKDSEAAQAKENGVEYSELKVGTDGISVVVHPESPLTTITTEQLEEIWKSGSTVKKWSDVDPSWPDAEIKLYGPDAESGTFDYFNEEILGDEGSPRSDYVASSDDNVLLNGVAGDVNALGYFGYAYYVNGKDKVKALSVASGDGEAVEPTAENIESGKYAPLSRPLFIYVNDAKVKASPVLKEFLKLYVSEEGMKLVEQVGYVQPSPDVLAATRAKVEELTAE